MLITPHMLVGAAIGAQSSNIWAAFCLGLVSHYFLDFLPHWDYLESLAPKAISYKKIGLDFMIGAGMVLILTWSSPQKFIILIALGAALLPDFFSFLYLNLKINWLWPLNYFHQKIHYWKGLSFWQGLPATIIVSLLAIFSLIL